MKTILLAPLVLVGAIGCHSAPKTTAVPDPWRSSQGVATFEERIDCGDGVPRIRRSTQEWYAGPEQCPTTISPSSPSPGAGTLHPMLPAPKAVSPVRDGELPQVGEIGVYGSDGKPARSFVGDQEVRPRRDRPPQGPILGAPVPTITVPPGVPSAAPKIGQPGFERTT